MKRFLALVLVFIIALAGARVAPAAAETVVQFDDPYLQMLVADALGVPRDGITTRAMEDLYELDIDGWGISSLKGLEYAYNLSSLSANYNNITDLTPIAGLSALGSLSLQHNGISDVSPLDALCNLLYLDLSFNLIQNLTGLGSLHQLISLNLNFNLIQNISPLTNLKNLMALGLWDNQVSDLTAVGTMRDLVVLNLGRNKVSSITPLQNISSLQWIALDHNQVTSLTPLASHVGLEVVSVENNNLTNYNTLLGLNMLSFVDLRFNTTAPSSTLVNQLKNKGVEVWHQENVHFADPDLEAEIRKVLKKSPTANITRAEMATLTTLVLINKDLVDLSGLEYAVNLKVLEVSNNYLTDLVPVRYLKNLEHLNAEDNYLETTWEYMGHPKLKQLAIDDNALVNIDFIRNMPNLESVKADRNYIVTIKGMAGLPKLEFINVSSNRLTTLSGLGNFTGLTGISASNNFIHNLQGLSKLTKLNFLNLQNNLIEDISALQTFPLRTLYIGENPISDIAPLLNIPTLVNVYLGLTNVDLSPDSPGRLVIRTLKARGVNVMNGPHFDVPAIERLAGNNRFLTAAAISQQGWAEGAQTVILARGDNYADALAGVPLAYHLDAPILLTMPTVLSPDTLAEIQRLGATNIIILGGTGAVSAGIEQQLVSMGYQVERIQGANRYATAANIARRMCPEGVSHAVVAFGNNFPDALAAASYAAREGYPILLTLQNSLPQDTANVITELGITNTIVSGGSGVVSDQVLALLPGGVRVAGSNRFATSVALANHFGAGEHMYVATGMNFADAITGAVLAAKEGTGLLLVGGREVDASVRFYVLESGVRELTIFGGFGAVSENFRFVLQDLLP